MVHLLISKWFAYVFFTFSLNFCYTCIIIQFLLCRITVTYTCLEPYPSILVMADIPTTMTGNPVMENNNVFTINTCFTSMLRLLWVQDGVLCGHNARIEMKGKVNSCMGRRWPTNASITTSRWMGC